MVGLFVTWLYIDAPRTYIIYMRGVTIALFHYFSISLLASTLFAPWRHDTIDLSRLPIRDWAQAIASNLFSRIIGFLVRSSTMLLGLFVLFTYTVGSIFFFVAWYVLPILLSASLVYGVQLLVRGSYG